MYLLVLVFGFASGFWACNMWGNHRGKYWKKKLGQVVRKAEAVHAANAQLIEVAKRVEKYERGEAIGKMETGLAKAIAKMSEDTHA